MVDAHYADPSKVLLLARALNVCPPQVFIVGCQPAFVEDAFEGLSPAVERAVPLAVERILALIEALQSNTSAPPDTAPSR
jgi:hydrogenase maturation protease